LENNLASYNSTVLYQGSNNVVGKDNLNAQTNQSFNTAVGCSIFTKTTGQFNTGMGGVLKKQQLVGIMSASVIIHFQKNIGNNIGIGFGLGVIVLSYNTFWRPDKNE
jgi:hypothetical protein